MNDVGLDLSREVWESDLRRHNRDLRLLLEAGLTEDHPMVVRARRRISGVEQVLVNPKYRNLVTE